MCSFHKAQIQLDTRFCEIAHILFYLCFLAFHAPKRDHQSENREQNKEMAKVRTLGSINTESYRGRKASERGR